jgi:transposase
MSDMMTPIRKYFTVETAPRQKDKWLIVCEKCGDMWHLAKNNTHAGNVLHLLNHARGHDKKKSKRDALDALYD